MKPTLSDLIGLTIILVLVFFLLLLTWYYGGVPLPTAAAAYCHDQAVDNHQQYLTALTVFSQKSREKLRRESQRRLMETLRECERGEVRLQLLPPGSSRRNPGKWYWKGERLSC